MLGQIERSEGRRSIWLPADRVDSVLDALDRGRAPVPANRREHRRHSWRGRGLIIYPDDADVEGGYRVQTRDVGVGGVGFLHGEPMEPGQVFRLRLDVESWADRDISALVARCRRVDGKVHEVGARFLDGGDGEEFLEAVRELGQLYRHKRRARR